MASTKVITHLESEGTIKRIRTKLRLWEYSSSLTMLVNVAGHRWGSRYPPCQFSCSKYSSSLDQTKEEISPHLTAPILLLGVPVQVFGIESKGLGNPNFVTCWTLPSGDHCYSKDETDI